MAGQIIMTGQIKSLDIQLIIISGSLIAHVYSAGQPVDGANVHIDALSLAATTDPTGTATILNISAGTWNVVASYPGKNPQSLSVTIDPNMTVSINFDLTPVS